MIGTCECCDRQNVPVSHIDIVFGIEAFACYLCQGEADPDPYGELENSKGDTRRQGHSKLVYDKASRTISAVDPSPLRWCGYCESWHSKPCGEQCHWLPTDPTIEQMHAKNTEAMRKHYRKHPLPVTFEKDAQ